MRRYLKFNPHTGACVGVTTLHEGETYHDTSVVLLESNEDPTRVQLGAGGGIELRVPPIEELREEKWREIKTARERAEAQGVTVDGVVYDSDRASITNVIGAAVLAQANPTAIWQWTTADNSVVALSASDVIALGTAIAAHVDWCHQRSRVLRAQIEAATTQAELDAIQW